MSSSRSFLTVMRRQQRRQVWLLVGAATAGAATAASSVLLLGLSGWFIAGAATAGLGGVSVVMAFNYLLPSAAIRLFAIIRTGGRYGERLWGHAAAFRAMAAFRAHVFLTLAMGRPEVSMGFSTGEASARLVQDVDAIENQFVGLSAPPSALIALAAGLCLTAQLGSAPVIVLLLGVAVQTLGGRLLQRHLTDAASASVQSAMGALKESHHSLYDAAPELICYNFTGRAVDMVMARDEALATARRRAARGEAAIAALQALSMALTAMGVLASAGQVTAALAAMAALGAAAAVEASAGLLRAGERKGAYLAAVRRLSEIETSPLTSKVALPETGLRLSLTVGARSVAVGAGERIAICGASGAGKTRLLEQLLKLRPVSDVQIEVSGVAIERLSTAAVRHLFAYLPQNAPVLSGSIRENLILADPTATDDMLWEALASAELAVRVAAMPLGLATWTGQAGERLSGGERRRLCLARAFLRPAQWLVLDEPTEGLDSTTEQRVVQNIEAHLIARGQGLILVSHRPYPLRLCPIQFEL